MQGCKGRTSAHADLISMMASIYILVHMLGSAQMMHISPSPRVRGWGKQMERPTQDSAAACRQGTCVLGAGTPNACPPLLPRWLCSRQLAAATCPGSAA
jgi:hypothetical protein